MALLPNPMGSTAKTSFFSQTIRRIHSLCCSLRVLCTKPSRDAAKADTNSLSLSCTTTAMMKIRLAQSIFRPDVKPLYRVTSQNKGSFCLLFHDQSERSPDCGLDADELTNNCIRRIFLSPTKKKKIAWSQVILSLAFMSSFINVLRLILCFTRYVLAVIPTLCVWMLINFVAQQKLKKEYSELIA